MWSGNHIGHHSTIGDNVFISSHVVVSGGVEVGENCFLGVNSTLVNDIAIGRDTWLGPHVVVTRDVEPGSVYRPARSEKRDVTSLECDPGGFERAAEAGVDANRDRHVRELKPELRRLLPAVLGEQDGNGRVAVDAGLDVERRVGMAGKDEQAHRTAEAIGPLLE